MPSTLIDIKVRKITSLGELLVNKNRSCYVSTSIPRHAPFGLWHEWPIKHHIIIISSVVWYFLMFTRNSTELLPKASFLLSIFFYITRRHDGFLSPASNDHCPASVHTLLLITSCFKYRSFWYSSYSNPCSCFSYSSAPTPAQSPTTDAQDKTKMLLIWYIS